MARSLRDGHTCFRWFSVSAEADGHAAAACNATRVARHLHNRHVPPGCDDSRVRAVPASAATAIVPLLQEVGCEYVVSRERIAIRGQAARAGELVQLLDQHDLPQLRVADPRLAALPCRVSVQDFRQDLHRVDDRGPGPVEVFVAVGPGHLPFPHRARSNQPGKASSVGASRMARSRSKPHGATMSHSGSASRTCCQSMARENSPFSPSIKRPLAASTSSGPQLPIAKMGSVHSSATTLGARRCLTASWTAIIRSFIAATRSTASRSRPSARPTEQIPSKIPCTLPA